MPQTQYFMPQVKVNIPTGEMYQFLLKTQGEMKAEKNTATYSLEKTILKVIKDFQKIKEGKKQFI